MSTTSTWTDGLSGEYDYDRYGHSPYYNVPDGWRILADVDWAGDYEFKQIVVWLDETTGELRAAYDSGCSCSTPFADLTLDRAKLVREVDDLQALVTQAAEYEDWAWETPDDKLADLKAKVHRALRDGVGAVS